MCFPERRFSAGVTGEPQLRPLLIALRKRQGRFYAATLHFGVFPIAPPSPVRRLGCVILAIAMKLSSPILVICALMLRLDGQSSGDGRITILQTTDLHHHANGTDHVGLDVDPVTGMGKTGAYARISAYVNYVRANAGRPVVLVDSGDWTMGTIYDLTLSSNPLALYFLDLMRYDCVTLGNHEFDYTPAGLAQILGAGQTSFGFKTPIVASNMNLGGSAALASFVGDGKAIQSTRLQQLSNGLRVGYIGLMGKAAAQEATSSAPVGFTDFSMQYAALQAMVDDLRNAQGAQVVIALSHSGTDASGTSGEDVDLARHVKGIDVIASGHTHTALSAANAVPNGTWTTQIIDAGAYGGNVSRIDLVPCRGQEYDGGWIQQHIHDRFRT